MPYIDQRVREILDRDEALRGAHPMNAGELNYALTRAVLHYMHGKGKSYQVLNEIVGVLASVKTEFERKVMAPYEDAKCEANGEVYS